MNDHQDCIRAGVENCDCIVYCDQDCGARERPRTLEETQAALEHWRTHSVHYGCSHGR